MKVFSQKMLEMDVYVQPERLEEFDASKDYIHLGNYEGRDYYSINPETVVLQEQTDDKYDIKEYDPSKKDDKAVLDSLKNKLQHTRELIIYTKQSVFADMDMFDMFYGLANNDKYVKQKINEVFAKIEADLANLGF